MAEDLRRLFEQGGDEEPVLTRRVAWGLAGTVTKNSTWQTIVTWLQTTLNFLKPANNLSDITDPEAARANLGIASQDLSLYALKSNVLELNNTVEFTPDNPYEPATAVYVGNYFHSRIYGGRVTIGDVADAGQSAHVEWAFGSDNYLVSVTIVSNGDYDADNDIFVPVVYDKTASGFYVRLKGSANNVQNISIDWIVYKIL